VLKKSGVGAVSIRRRQAIVRSEEQSIEADPGRRKQLVWAIERKLAEDGARPIIFYSRGGTCWQALCRGADDHGQQPAQRQSHGGRLARPIAFILRESPANRPRDSEWEVDGNEA
jgi:hypothetical protein